MNIINVFSQLCAGPICYIRELEENLKALRTSIEELKDVKDDVIARVKIQEANRMRRTHQVEGWLEKADAMEVEVEGILREGYEEIADRFLGGFCPRNCYASYKLGEKIVQKKKYVDELKGQGRGFEIVAETLPPAPVQEMPTVPVTGMDLMFEKAWSYINNEDVGIMGVYGIGGVGKTTLLQRINNKFRHQQTIHFDVVIWVVVSKEVNEMKIQDDVAKRVGLPLSEDKSLDDRALTLHSVLSEKRFVLFLDDVWKAVNLTAVGIPRPDPINKSKLVFTTRSEDVCGQMEAHTKIRVECLEWPEAWKLFQEKVGEEALKAHPKIRAVAEDVAKECAGLPLALITTGRAMACKKTHQEWRYAVSTLKNSASEFSGMKKNVYSTLKFSYESLEDDTIRSCFLYCSMFPEDHSIKIEQLVRYWIGEGFLDDFDNMDEAEHKGYAIVGILKQACLLESGLYSPRAEVKMHDVIRDLALWIGCDYGRKKNKLLVRAGVPLTEAPEVGKWREAERISLMFNNIKKLANEAPECPNLLTLIISENRYLGNISDGFFQFMNVLKVLDLSYTRINALPTCIVELVELEYLSLANTHIKMLPPEMKNLVKLKCLDLSYTYHLRFIPCEILSSFSKLQVLDILLSKHWDAKSDDIASDEENAVANIKELGCLSNLKYLSIETSYADCLNGILANEKLARCVRHLYFRECKKLIPVILKHGPLSNVREVNIRDCELKDLSWLHGSRNIEFLKVGYCNSLRDGITGGCFPNLDHVEIEHCNELKDISWLQGAPQLSMLIVFRCKGLQQICQGTDGCFTNLRSVKIQGCNALKDLSWLRGAPNLEQLDVHYCEGLELICDVEDAEAKESQVKFSRLSSLTLINLPKLKRIPWHAFPPDARTTVEDCPEATPLNEHKHEPPMN